MPCLCLVRSARKVMPRSCEHRGRRPEAAQAAGGVEALIGLDSWGPRPTPLRPGPPARLPSSHIRDEAVTHSVARPASRDSNAAGRRPRSADALDVGPRAGVDANDFAGFHKQRYLHDRPRLQGRRLGGTAHRVAANPRRGLDNAQIYGVWQLSADRLVFVKDHRHIRVLAQESDGLTEQRAGKRHLLERSLVHDDVLIAGRVQVLHRFLLQIDERHALPGAKRSLGRRARLGVADLGLYIGRPPANLDVLGLDDGVQVAVEKDVDAGTEVIARDHAASPTGSVPAARRRCQPRAGARDAAPPVTMRRAQTGSSMSSFGACVSTRQPSEVTTTSSSIRTPPHPGRYTPGSIVSTIPDSSGTSIRGDNAGPSWISSPIPWPSPCPNASPYPAAAIISRLAWSTAREDAPARTASIARRCARNTTP